MPIDTLAFTAFSNRSFHGRNISNDSLIITMNTTKTITGKYNKAESWEKASVYNLSNGVTATISFSFYGEMINRLEDATGYWHCSNGNKSIPERFAFALPWLEPYLSHSPSEKLMRPRFERIF